MHPESVPAPLQCAVAYNFHVPHFLYKSAVLSKQPSASQVAVDLRPSGSSGGQGLGQLDEDMPIPVRRFKDNFFTVLVADSVGKLRNDKADCRPLRPQGNHRSVPCPGTIRNGLVGRRDESFELCEVRFVVIQVHVAKGWTGRW